MAFVYLLWSHDECGPKDLVATTDKSKVVDLAAGQDRYNWFESVGARDLPAKVAALLEGDVEPGTHSLMGGWGGLHLQIVELA